MVVVVTHGELPAPARAEAGFWRWVAFQWQRHFSAVLFHTMRADAVVAGFALHYAADQGVVMTERWTEKGRQLDLVRVVEAGATVRLHWWPKTWRDALPAGAVMKPVIRSQVRT